MARNLNLEVLKGHLFETLEGIKNQNDPEASECEKISIEQAKAIVGVSEALIEVYKTQVDALKVVANMDHVASAGVMLTEMGFASDDEVKMIM